MKAEQAIVAEWMQRQMKRTGWTSVEWARRAKISASTVTRATHSDYNSITTLATLDKLARAAGAESVLEFLART